MSVETGDPRADSRWHMLTGISLLESGRLAEAGRHFDRAIVIRETLPWREDAESAWMLAAAWLNRSDVLRGTRDPGLLPEAIRSLDRGIEAMGYVPLGASPAFVERLMLAWINRGTALGEAGDPAAAWEDFNKAGELFEKWGDNVTRERRFLASMLRVNRARVMMNVNRPSQAWLEAREGWLLLEGLPVTLQVAEAAIKARSVGCRALAMMLDEEGGEERAGDWIAQATDLVEEALKLVKRTGFLDAWVGDLVRYGAKIYRCCQPQFLGEFLAEWLAPGGPLAEDRELKRQMCGELLLARAEVERKVLRHPHDTDFVERQISILKLLQSGEERLGKDA